MQDSIEKAIKILKEGGIVIFPTDTAFGIGCRVDDKKAVKRLFTIRKRSSQHPVSVLVDTVKMAEEYVLPISKDVLDKLIDPYWPGALTVVLPCHLNKVFSFVRGGGMTLGVRIPNHSITRALIRGVGVGILGPSANFHGQKTPYAFADLDLSLVAQVDYVLSGTCPIGTSSTVIDCSKESWVIIRQGAITVQNVKIKMQNDNDNEKRNVVLSIDTSSNQAVAVMLCVGEKKYILRKKIGMQKAQVVLPLMQKLLKKHSLKLTDIQAIQVNSGPGSFTGVRVGVAIANALSFALKIPVNRKQVGEFVEPLYQ